jgi:hypothetical protein
VASNTDFRSFDADSLEQSISQTLMSEAPDQNPIFDPKGKVKELKDSNGEKVSIDTNRIKRAYQSFANFCDAGPKTYERSMCGYEQNAQTEEGIKTNDEPLKMPNRSVVGQLQPYIDLAEKVQ